MPGAAQQCTADSIVASERDPTHLLLALATSEIDEVELAHTDVVLPVDADLDALHRDDEDGVRTGRVLVHRRLPRLDDNRRPCKCVREMNRR